MTKAHEATVHIAFIERWPDHTPRKDDPYYKYFKAAKKRLKKAGLLRCVVAADHHYGAIELHHSKVEFAHINDVDLDKFNAFYGLNLDDEAFQRYVEEEGNLEPLCTEHHRGTHGVHGLPEPQWRVLRVAKNPENVLIVQHGGGSRVIRSRPSS